jgi:hypothetical protein
MSSGKKAAVWVGGVVVALAVIGAALGGSDDKERQREPEKNTEAAPAAPAAPEPPPPATIDLRSPDSGDTIRKPAATVTGLSEPGAKVTLTSDAGRKRVKADSRGQWRVSLPLGLGENSIAIKASAPGRSQGSMSFLLTRRRSSQELAAIRQRKRERQQQKRQAFIASAITIPYNQLEKNPDKHTGTKVKYTGQIFQIQEDAGATFVLLAVTNEGYGFWTDNIWVDYNGEIAGAEDDIITIYGTVTGSKSYETQIGGETYVPQVRAKYVDG